MEQLFSVIFVPFTDTTCDAPNLLNEFKSGCYLTLFLSFYTSRGDLGITDVLGFGSFFPVGLSTFAFVLLPLGVAHIVK